MQSNRTLKKLALLLLPLCATFSFASAQNTNKSGLTQIRQTVAVQNDMVRRMQSGALEQKDRRALAIAALENYLRELVGGENTQDPKISSWLKQLSKNRFDAYVPSWNVKLHDNNNEAEVNLVLALNMFRKDVEKSPYSTQLKAISPHASEATQTSMPAAAILIDETTEVIYTIPAIPLSSSNAQIQTGKQYKRAPTERVLLNPELSPSDKLGAYAFALSRHLEGHALEFDPLLAENTVRFILEAKETRGQAGAKTQLWPPFGGISASTLKPHAGIVMVFTTKGADKAAIIEKVDIIRLKGGGQHNRSFWSRNLNDPTRKEQPNKIFEKVSSHFLKQARSTLPATSDNKVRLIVDKKVSDRDLAAIENIFRPVALGADIVFVPYEVNKADIRYHTGVETSRAAKLVARINKDVPSVYARVVPGEGFIQINPSNKGAN